MPSQLYFFASILFSFIVWGLITKRYLWPYLRGKPRTEALKPILILHSFRYMGLAFVVPGVVSPELPSTLRACRRVRRCHRSNPCAPGAGIAAIQSRHRARVGL